MITYAEIEDYVQDQINDTSTKMQTFIRRAIRQGLRKIRANTPWEFDEKTYTFTTTASQGSADLPVGLRYMKEVYITVGSQDFPIEPIASREDWAEKTRGYNSNHTSDYPSYYTIYDNQIHFWPVISSAGNTVTMKFGKVAADILDADFTDKSAGTISATQGDATLTGSGTSFAETDVDRFVRLNSGDRQWYKITTFTSTTSIEVEPAYTAAAVSGSDYLLGSAPPWVSRFPEGNEILYNYVMWQVQIKREEYSGTAGLARAFRDEYKELLKDWRKVIKKMYDGGKVNVMMARRNPNDYPLNLSA